MPTLLPAASRLLLLPRALLSMASGSPPAQPSSASGSAYVPGSVSAAFVTCPNEKVAKEIARWGLQCEARKGAYEGRVGGAPPAASRLSLGCQCKNRVMGPLNGAPLFTFRAVVEKRLAACVNLVPQITSM